VHEIRWVALDGLVNLRDVGGMPTRDGGAIRRARLYRSDNLQELPAASIARLVGELGVTDVVDLRSNVERAREGDSPVTGHPALRIRHYSMYADDAQEGGLPEESASMAQHELPWVIQARRTAAADRADRAERPAEPPADAHVGPRALGRVRIVPDGIEHDTFWSAHYLGYLQERPDSVVGALRAIGEADGAALVHCAAGKDRTGTVVALALELAGARREAIVADYAATAERVPQILERLARRPAYAKNLEGKTVAEQSPQPETMRRLLAALDRERGGLRGWLGEHGWRDEDTDRLVTKLTGKAT